MTISEIKTKYQSELVKLYSLNEINSIFLLLMADISYTQLQINMNRHSQLSETESAYMLQSLHRLHNSEPVQYIRGKADFYGYEFRVNPHVLIPRQETELLVHTIARNHALESLTIVDIGTGSGCIAISLALQFPHWRVKAIDVSPQAIDVASGNAKMLGAEVEFYIADMQNISEMKKIISDCELIVSNPPYVCTKEKKEMKAHVLNFEPHTALFVADDNPLQFYSSIAVLGREILPARSYIYCEINEHLGKQTSQLFEKEDYRTQILLDLHEKQRFIQAQLL